MSYWKSYRGTRAQGGRPIQRQDFGENPTEVRDTNHYEKEYVQGFVEKWDELIDWRRRYESEGTFFIDQLKARGVKRVLDVATGTGFHSVRLVQEGFDTVSADGSQEMLRKAFENGFTYGQYVLKVVQADWRYLNRDVHGEFDAIICLGNSFTHLFSERDRRKALAEFYALLKHDGVLIIDQRNYDSILDNGFSSTHSYYYCGEEVTAEPEYVDEGLARFRYRFPDGSDYALNMFPLRKDYMRRLMREVGFQRVDTFGDFQKSYHEDDPDFFIHVAEKMYREDDSGGSSYSTAVNTAREYYNSEDADAFYHSVWGGQHIHVGVYEDGDTIDAASGRTVERMASGLELTPDVHVLDVGAGFGGSARHLARTYGCKVTCLNLSEVENARNRAANKDQGLDELIDVVDGSFEELPFNDNAFHVVWSQDALLHGGDRIRALEEIVRVLKPGGDFVFTDPMAADDCPRDALRPILDRLHLDTMGSPGFYRRELARLGLSVRFDDLTEHLTTHYGRVLRETEEREAEMSGQISAGYLEHMKTGLRNWVDGGANGRLKWGIIRCKN
ncbi:class I SAM-dependent methyltransferase [Actinomadura sp. WMMB 499]|uniref:glycine/sarcosine N-methyltransferase n=1 Tax=Actinomadura sp. WMMB 499 TaxID=1219491 RepID=UPI0020C7E1D6|nr:class I SAM-dependent methyltransferase [Actinomadura sp. WMMB 499]